MIILNSIGKWWAAIKKVFRASSSLLRWWLCWVSSVQCPATSPFPVCLVRVTPSSSIVNFSFSSCYNLKIGFNFMSYLKFQMKVWDILPSPWAEVTAKLSIQDSFHSLHSILTACFTVDGLISVGKPPPYAAKDRPLSPQHENWLLAKGSLAEPQPRRVLGHFWWVGLESNLGLNIIHWNISYNVVLLFWQF